MWDPADPTDALTTLGELIATHAPGPDDLPSRTARTVSEQPDHHQPTVRIITLREPPTELAGRVAGQSSGPVEFLDAPHIKADHPDAVAVRIDGESMSPEIRHGDLVVLSPSAPAEAGRAAVVQLSGAIGVTCKLYHPAGPRVHLVPINDQFPPTTVEAQTVEWALKVLACIRP
jgi:hypothetical protein